MTQRQRSQLKELLLIEANKESIQHKSHHFYLYLLIKRLVLTSLKELQSLKRIKLEVSLSPPPLNYLVERQDQKDFLFFQS